MGSDGGGWGGGRCVGAVVRLLGGHAEPELPEVVGAEGIRLAPWGEGGAVWMGRGANGSTEMSIEEADKRDIPRPHSHGHTRMTPAVAKQ